MRRLIEHELRVRRDGRCVPLRPLPLQATRTRSRRIYPDQLAAGVWVAGLVASLLLALGTAALVVWALWVVVRAVVDRLLG